MTIPHKLPISSSAENTKGQTHNLDDDDDPVFLHLLVSFSIFFTFVISAAHIQEDLGRWHVMIINAIVLLYLAVMLNLLLIKRRDEKRRAIKACEVIIRGPELTSSLMSVATVIMVVALATAVFVFRPDWLDLCIVALCILLSILLMLFLLIFGEVVRRRWSRAKGEDVSDLV